MIDIPSFTCVGHEIFITVIGEHLKTRIDLHLGQVASESAVSLIRAVIQRFIYEIFSPFYIKKVTELKHEWRFGETPES